MGDLPEGLRSLDDLKPFPYNGIRPCSEGGRMLLCPQGEIQRICFRTDNQAEQQVQVNVYFIQGKEIRTYHRTFMAGLGEFIYPGSRTMVAMPFSRSFWTGRTDRRRNQTYRSTSPLTGNNKTYGELKTILKRSGRILMVGMLTALLSMLRNVWKRQYKESTDIRGMPVRKQ